MRRAIRGTGLLIPGALAVAGFSFVLPALALPGRFSFFACAGLGTIVLLAAAPAVFYLCGLAIDRVMYALVACLTGVGVALLARLGAAGPVYAPLAIRQMLWLALGLGAMAGGIACGRSYLMFQHYRYVLLLPALILMALVVPFGVEVGGARAWLQLGPGRLQPSELARPAVLFFLASYLGQHLPLLRASGRETVPLWRRRWLLWPVIAMWLLALGLLLLQRDLGMATLYFASFLVLLYLASGRMAYLAGGTALGVLGCLAAAAVAPHARNRLLAWLYPLRLAGGVGFQGARSLFSLGAGGLFGTGPGLGLPHSVPAVQTDLVFAAVVEELGLAGAFAVLLLLLALVSRGLSLAGRCRDRVGFLFGAGLSFSLGLQALLIVAGTCGLLPLTGVTLPLVSYGGSSLFTTLFSLGALSGMGHEDGRRGFAD